MNIRRITDIKMDIGVLVKIVKIPTNENATKTLLFEQRFLPTNENT